VNGERKAWYIYIPCQGLLEMAGPMGEGGIRYSAVYSGRVGVFALLPVPHDTLVTSKYTTIWESHTLLATSDN
jgi:hypothetical protein